MLDTANKLKTKSLINIVFDFLGCHVNRTKLEKQELAKSFVKSFDIFFRVEIRKVEKVPILASSLLHSTLLVHTSIVL